ncbi:Epsin domain-containing protein [Cinnamomum micranthum f. kanehirae]|uniref:Epsin domain-containing protein n=1 Tax=Cinnamomum micranthum f. kanehirae TaxID=337451 RepID=A0A443NIF8_9MAGN|nr:Epsin domain-containing protein [Cinnamomum micranthum f. kanehirae]
MDSSRRAVESYWRSKMIDGVTTDEDKVAPVYKLEEICELLRSSNAGTVKEVSEFILKRLDHKSPIVKQKALRLIKYSVGKSGVEFKREMQRHSAVIRQLFHYKGNLDPLKGDALNKAVRDIAHEAMSAVFSSEDKKPAPSENINRRIQGFGNTNFEVQTDDKKSFLSEVVGLGSASIRQGLNTFTAAHSLGKNDNGSYKSPNLGTSLTIEAGSPDRYEREEQSRGSWGTYETSRNVGAGPWVQDSRATAIEMMNGDTGSGHTGVKSREERLLETIVSSGGVRLHPTRDALQIFLVEASKLDPLALSHALESKLNSHLWQVRMKAVCVLESILRKKDDAIFSTIASYFSENIDVIIKCSESPQSSLREKANKVLSLLDGEKIAGANTLAEKPSTAKAQTDVVQMPDLIDTNYQDDYGNEDSTQKQMDQSTPNPTAASPVVDDLFGGSTTPSKKEDDPFSDVSFHSIDDKGHSDDIFSGLTVDDKQASIDDTQTNKCGPELFDVFSSYPTQPTQETTNHKRDVNDLMADLSINVMAPEQRKQPGNIGGPFSEITFSDLSNQSTNPAQNEVLNSVFHSPTVGGVSPSNPTSLFPLGPIQYSIPPNFVFNQGLSSQPINYSAMASLIAQQQLLATINFQHLGNLGAPGNSGLGHAAGIGVEGGNSAFPDIFQLTNNPITSISTAANTSKKEETKAFDFISEHLSAARDMKRVV